MVNDLAPSADIPATEAESRSSKPQEYGLVSSPSIDQTGHSTPLTTFSPDEHTSERHLENKRHEMASNGRNPASAPISRAGTQTPKADHRPGVSTMTKRTQPQKPGPIQTTKELYQAFNIQPPRNDPIESGKQSNALKMNEPRQGSATTTPGPKETPASSTRQSPNRHSAEPDLNYTVLVQDRRPIEIDDQSSSSSDDDAAHLATGAGRKAEERIEDAESTLVDEPDHLTKMTSLPDDHPIEWLAEARETYQHSLPPFVTKRKLGVRRIVELPLAEGQRHAGKAEVVYRSWDALHTFASIDIGGQRFIVKVFRGGATPHRPWLGPEAGFSETALAFSKQFPRGPKALATTQGKRISLPKGWALREEDERDDDYSPANRRKSAPVRRRPRRSYDLNYEEEDPDEDPFREDSYQIAGQVHSERSSIEGDYAAPKPAGDQFLDTNLSTTQPPSKLVNAVEKSLRLPKEQDAISRAKQIKRRSIGGQEATTDSGGNKRQKHKADFSSGSDNPVHHKRAKDTKTVPHRTVSPNAVKLKNVSVDSKFEPFTLDAQTLSPYKQSHTTLRIALVPYPRQSAIQRLRSSMTMATFFSTVTGVSGYKGDKDRIFGITATFDCKPEDDADRSMVIREEWPDSFDIFLETVDGAESWTEEGGKCSVAVSLLLTEG